MAGDGKQHVFGVNAFTVVCNADEFHAATLDIHVDASGEGVDGVFEQLFDDAAGAFDDFPGGDAIDDVSIELLDAGHAGGGLWSAGRKSGVLILYWVLGWPERNRGEICADWAVSSAIADWDEWSVWRI